MDKRIPLSIDPAPPHIHCVLLQGGPLKDRHRSRENPGLIVLGTYYPVFLLYRGTRAGAIPNVWSILIDVLWYPLYEEVSYRGFFLGFFARENTNFTSYNLGLNLAQALLFASIHHYHVSAGVPLLLIPVFLLGFFNGLVFLRARNVLGCIVGHAVANGTAWLMSILTQ